MSMQITAIHFEAYGSGALVDVTIEIGKANTHGFMTRRTAIQAFAELSVLLGTNEVHEEQSPEFNIPS